MPKIISNFLLETLLGSGQYGKVYKAKNLETSEYFAIKSLKTSHLQKLKLENTVQNELMILQSISCPHIVRFYELKQTPTHYYLIYEYCNGGTLEAFLGSVHHLEEKDAIPLFSQLLIAFRTLSSRGIVHRDLKPSNILFHNGVLKLADFGFSKLLSSASDLMETMVGSPLYMAPEILQGQPYDKKSDIWSLGIVLYQILFGAVPFEENSLAELIKRTGSFDKIELFKGRKQSKMVDLLGKMLERDPGKRVDWEEIFATMDRINEIGVEAGGSGEKGFFVLNLERTKIHFLYEVLEEMLRLRLSEDVSCFAALMSKIWHLARNLKDHMIKSFRREEFPWLQLEKERVEEIRKSDSFKQWGNIFLRECERIERNYKAFQIESKKDDKYDENQIHKRLFDYCFWLREKSSKEGLEKEDQRRILLHLNMVLETINIHEFVQNYLELGRSLKNQRYFEILRSYELESLRNVAMNKLALFKTKFRSGGKNN